MDKSSILHNGLIALRRHFVPKQTFKNLNKSFLENSADAKVVFERLSPNIFEFKLNNNNVLNSIDIEMCELILQKLKAWH